MSKRTLGLLAIGALALRLVYGLVLLAGGHYQPVADAHDYHAIASAVADGRGFSHDFPFAFQHATAWRPPLYPLILAGVYWVFGPSVEAGQVLGALIGTGVVVLGALLAARLAGPGAGLLAGIILAVYPPLVAADVTLLSESVSLLLLLATALLLDARRWSMAGVCAGLITVARPSAQVLAVAIGAWIVWKAGWRNSARFLGCAILVLSPWLLRNWVQMERPVLVTSNGFNVASLYSPAARADDAWVDPVYDVRFDGLRQGVTSEVTLDRRFRDVGWDALKADPGYVFHVVVRHLPRFFEVDPHGNEKPEMLDGRSIQLRTWTLPLFYAVTAAGLAGMWRLWRRRSGQPLVIAAAYFAAASLAFGTAPRLRAPFDLVCAIGAAVLVTDLLAARKARTGTPQPAPEPPDSDPDDLRSPPSRTTGTRPGPV